MFRNQSLYWSPTSTLDLACSYSFRSSSVIPVPMLAFSIECHSTSCHTLSNALRKSMKFWYKILLVFLAFSISSLTLVICSVVLLHGLKPSWLSLDTYFLLNSSVHSSETRQSSRGEKRICRKEEYASSWLSSLLYMGAKRWNDLLLEIRNFNSKVFVQTKAETSFAKSYVVGN